MKIGIDIDGTVTDNFTLIKNLACTYFNKPQELIKQWDWDLTKVFDIKHDQALKFWEIHEEHIYTIPGPHPFAVETINNLAKKHEIIYITARTPQFARQTITWLEQHKIYFNNLFMTKEKKEVCITEGISIMVDDAPEYVSIAEHIPVILFDYPYNQNVNHPQIIRVTSWPEVQLVIENQFEN